MADVHLRRLEANFPLTAVSTAALNGGESGVTLHLTPTTVWEVCRVRRSRVLLNLRVQSSSLSGELYKSRREQVAVSIC